MIWLHNARTISIFAVVFLHVAASVVANTPIGSDIWWIGNVYDSLVRWCVPVFVMISGALLLDPRKTEDIKTFYIKRLSRILTPLIFWSVFFLLWASLKGIIKKEHVEILNLAKTVLSGKPHYHMWFLYMITVLYLFTPFFRKVIANSSSHEISILIYIATFIAALNAFARTPGGNESKLFINWFLSYIPYFFLGHLIRISTTEYKTSFLATSFISFSLLTSIGFYFFSTNTPPDAGFYFYDYLSITVIPMSISAMLLLKKLTKPVGNVVLTEKLASLTLGVYLVHPIFLEAIRYLWDVTLTINAAISVPLLSIAVFTLSLATAWVISKIPYINKVI